MATIDWPTTLRGFYPSRMTWGASTPKTSWASPYSGQVQSISHAGDRLRCVIDLPPLKDPAAAAVREAFFMAAYSSGDWLRVPHFLRSVPRGTLRGSPFVATPAAAGARSLQIGLCNQGNLLVQPNAFGVSPWGAGITGGLAAVTDNVRADPFGEITADEIIDASADVVQARSQAITVPADDQTYKCSVYVLKTTGGTAKTANIAMYLTGGTPEYRFAPLNTDTGISTLGPIVESVGDWWRFTHYITNNGTNTSLTFELIPAAREPDGISGGESTTGSAIFALAQILACDATTADAEPITLLGGDLLQVGNQMLCVGYAGAVSDENGLMTVPLALPLRVAVAEDAPVIWDRPTATFQLQGVESIMEYGPRGVQQGLQVTLSEVFA